MTHFLRYVAEDLIERGLDLSETAIIFPNKRASLFLDKHLDSLQAPFLPPNYITINELFSQFSSLEIADPILLNTILYRIYKRFLQSDETFDEFYFWGELLLRDFDDLDKHLVDAGQLFLNIQNIKAMEDPMQYLTEEQIQALRQFFVNFDPQKNSELKERFIRIWSVLSDVYELFSETLKSQNLAYDGLLMRDVVENKLDKETFDLPYKNYVFVGFNALSTAEELLFKFFKNTQSALFYWDYDESFFKIPNHEAGFFIKKNLENFGNALNNPVVFNSFQESQKTKHITFIASPTENAQTRFADQWLNSFKNSDIEASENAIVLCNENLLVPLTSALSGEGDINITMGYPVKQMPIADTVRQKIEQDLIEKYQPELSSKNLQHLVDRILSTMTIPFLGEPVLGTQIMGVLETRNLDFKHVLMLSVNEGMLPKSANDGSFIPYTFRKAFGMTTPEQKSAVYAYHFFRLMQRADNITLAYNTATEGLNRGEMSRFMLQLMIENGFEIEHRTLSTPAVELQQSRKIEIPKTPEIRNILLEKYGKDTKNSLSPSAINTFLTCKLKFYLHYVVGLRVEEPDVSDMNAAMIGTWFHKSAEILYRTISNQLIFDKTNQKFTEFSESLIHADDLNVYLDDEKREKLVDSAFMYENDNNVYSGEHLIVRRLLADNLKRLISLDIEKVPFTLLAMEKKISEVVEIDDIAIKIGGFVDRIDNIDGYLRVVDYKTGGRLKMFKTDKLQDLFDEKKISENKNYLQVLIYSWLLAKTSGNRRILPCLLHIHEAHQKDYSSVFLPNDFNEISEEFEACISDLLKEMLDPNTEFTSTETPANCRYCDYLNLCRKKVFEF
ncbi:MAG: PD-(D/E)XK nuclease family protein [Bacteroidales bacterium]|nr:PD-(D/E)XK nuclease family protein [Bacteroidales bacterium]